MHLELQDRIDPRSAARPRPAAASAALPCATPSSTSGCPRCARATCRRSDLDAMEPFYPLHVYVCERVLPGAARGVRRPRGDLHASTRTSPRTRTRWLAHARDYVDDDRASASAWAPRASSSSSPATTATCSSISSSKGIPASASSPPPTSPRRPWRRASRRSSRSSAREHAPASWSPRARQADLHHRQQRPRARARTSNDFVAGIEAPARSPAASSRSSSRTCMRLIDGEPVRHDLPRALLVLLVPDRRRRSSPPTASTLFDVEELPTHGGSLRIYAQPRRRPPRKPVERRVPSCGARESDAGLRPARGATPRSREQRRRRRSGKLLEFLIEAKRRRQVRRRLRRPRQGQHAAQLLRHPHRLPRLHGRPQPLQAGQVPAGHAHPDPPPRARSRETRPDYVLILPWNLKEEIMAPDRLRPGVGGALRGADPGGGGAVNVVIFCGGQGLRSDEVLGRSAG